MDDRVTRAGITPPSMRLVLHDERAPGRLTLALIERLIQALRADTDAVAVTLEGVDVFCDGLDLTTLVDTGPGGHAAVQLERFGELLDAIAMAPRPVIALVDGSARGGGLGVAAAADLIIATSRATFGLPEGLFGLVPALAFPVLARRVGPVRARWLALSGTSVNAAEAWRLGLVDELTENLDGSLHGHLRRLSRMDPRAVAALKAMSVVHDVAPASYRAQAVAQFRHLCESDATRERVTRFMAGETPWPEAPEP